MMKHETIQLVRKGGVIQDTLRELAVRISPPAARTWLPPMLTKEAFIVPRGKFATPIDMDGTPIRARVPGTNEQIEIYPELRLVGVENGDGGDRLAIALYHHLDRQIATIAERTDGIFRSVIGLHPDMDQLQKIATLGTMEHDDLARRIAADLGLLVEWTLQPEARAARLLRELRNQGPVQRTLSFNAELPAAEFKLTFTLTVQGADLRQVHQVLRRVELGLTVEKEIERIFERVKNITAPAFRSTLMGVTQWNQEIIRELSSDGIASVVARKIQEDFGYLVKFSNFSAELNQELAEGIRKMAEQSRQHLQEDVDRKRKLISTLKDKRSHALESSEGDFEDVAYLETRIQKAEEEYEQAQKIALNSIANNKEVKLLDTSEPIAIEKLQMRFNHALTIDDSSESMRRYGKNHDQS